MELLNTHSNRVWANSDDFHKLISKLGDGEYEPYSLHDVDYLPEFKFRRVIKRLKLSQKMIATIHKVAYDTNTMDCGAKKYRKYDIEERALIALEKLNRKYKDGYIDSNGLTIVKELEPLDAGLRHSIGFMPSLKEQNIHFYKFMCSFIRICHLL